VVLLLMVSGSRLMNGCKSLLTCDIVLGLVFHTTRRILMKVVMMKITNNDEGAAAVARSEGAD
jgi:hypothetical protein